MYRVDDVDDEDYIPPLVPPKRVVPARSSLPPGPPPTTRPGGVTAIAVLNFLNAGVYLLLPLLVLRAGEYSTLARFRGLVLCSAPLGVALALAVGVGLLRLRRWSLWLAVGLYGLSALAALLVAFARAGSAGTWMGFLAALLLVGYLLQPTVRQHFDA